MLFGHQNDDTIQPTVTAPPSDAMPPDMITPSSVSSDSPNPLAVDPSSGISLPTVPADDLDEAEPNVLNQPEPKPEPEAAETAPVISMPEPPDLTEFTAPALAENEPVVDTPPDLTPPPMPRSTPSASPLGAEELLSLKQEALAQLSPLVGHLDQTPEEKFRTTMMMIQSTDNQALIKDAYDAAQGITDDKVRAQALLDVVNEINYFTQQKP